MFKLFAPFVCLYFRSQTAGRDSRYDLHAMVTKGLARIKNGEASLGSSASTPTHEEGGSPKPDQPKHFGEASKPVSKPANKFKVRQVQGRRDRLKSRQATLPSSNAGEAKVASPSSIGDSAGSAKSSGDVKDQKLLSQLSQQLSNNSLMTEDF